MSVLENFKIYPGRSLIGRQAQSVIFFLQICNEVPGEKKRDLSPPQRATGHFFFLSRNFVANLKKKNYTLGLSPYGRATGVYF